MFFSGHEAASLIGILAFLGHFSWVFQPAHLLFSSPCSWESSYSGSFEKASRVLKAAGSLHCEPMGIKQETKERWEKDK